MGREIELSSNENNFIIEGFKSGLRLDGRKLDEIRQPVIRVLPDEYGYVEIDWGKTKLTVRVSAEVVKPFEDRPFEGIFTINTEISPMASPQFEQGRVSDDEILMSRLIEKAIRRSNALDLEALCMVAGAKVWYIRADVNVLEFDGGIIDAASFGVMVALQHFRKPDVSIHGSDVIIHSLQEREPVPLSVLHVPICVTFSFFNPSDSEENIKGELNEEISIIDATEKEESLRDGSLVITINKNREIVQLSKNGGLPIDVFVLMDLSKKAYTIAESLSEKIKAFLQKEESERYNKLHLDLLESGAAR
ncbi:Piso0_005372 [Millerozyma farinosa CBS 7064]|uniref:Exosome complex component RRP45 n=1 Tax=Pichia sorbitophila (strain ATCC MYA-4447 / BCRC 22081 / CBS 7064 / NBRC 10061 / NRRL Y-12695) TaxID=559304 RepID=G8Y4X7_PICSO|nr:Piso0_005372 [Millerozyma farinosa CBS 7064]